MKQKTLFSFSPLILLILLLLNHQGAEALTVNCGTYGYTDYYTNNLYQAPTVYWGYVANYADFTGSNIVVNGATGTHMPGKTNNDVTAFVLKNANSLTKFPSNIPNVFPNIILLEIRFTAITYITADDLKVFTKLRFLSMSLNQIKYLYKETFRSNPLLELIALTGNQISHIDPTTFTNLPNLRMINVDQNTCKLAGRAYSKEELLKVIKPIEDGQCVTKEYATTTTTPNPACTGYVTKLATCEANLLTQTNQVALLSASNQQLTAENQDLKAKLLKCKV